MPDLIRSVFTRMQTYVQDRRHPPRLRVRLVFTVSLCRNSHVKGMRTECALKGYTRDLSAGGLALNLPQVHLDGHYLADEEREVKVSLELPTGPISMRVIPRRYERLEQAELGCKYQIGVQITEISDEDRKRYLSFIAPEDVRSFPAGKEQIAPEVGRRLSAVQKEIAPENLQSLAAVQTEIAAEDVRSLPAIQTKTAPETEVSYAPIEQEPTLEGTFWATWWRELAWKPIYQITEISDEDRKRYLRLIAPQGVRSFPAMQREIAPGNGRSLPAIQREIAPENGRSLPAIQEQIAQALQDSYAPIEQEPTRRGLAWKPIYAAAIIVIGIALVSGAALQLKRRAENLRAKEAQANPAVGPDNRAANDLSPLATPNESPVENPDSSAAIIALNDRAGMVTVDNGGNVSGLDDVPAPTRDDIAKALLSERIARPAVLKDLAGKENVLRGSENAQPFKLIFPSRAVIVSDRPALKWERVSGASSYRVYVNDSAGKEMARSEELPSERTEWLLPKPLKRGEVYAWTVVAAVDGKEIASPGPSAPKMKFQVLSASNLQQLTRLKKTGSNLALGVFYSREGMIPGAEREFEALVHENPGSAVAKKLLSGVQSWQKQPAAENSSSAKKQSVPQAGAREVTVQVTYDENGRVTQASGEATALRIARQKRFPAGKAGSATITIRIN
jgi:hypothetical protein